MVRMRNYRESLFKTRQQTQELTMTTPFLVKLLKSINLQRLLLVGIVSGFCAQTSIAEQPGNTANASPVVVGEVSWLLGKAFIQAPAGQREAIAVGTSVHVNDRILTESGGHVHVRFVDDALVSVRPGSRLEILRYDFDLERPEQSTVKFNLVEGVTRAISGEAARSARERFRLNTPIAAIGVRGTDFVVSATDQTVRALVNEGVIVVAPYSTECAVDAFGPCTSNAVELTQNSLQMLELDQGAPLPVLLPAQDERDLGSLSEEMQLASTSTDAKTNADVEEKTAATEVYLENVTSSRVTADVAKTAQPPVKPPVAVLTPDVTPAAALSYAELDKRQLVWGRFAGGTGSAERITATYTEARSSRSVTVGSLDYAMFRPEKGSIVINHGLGVVGFSLSSAQAFFTNASGTSPMRVASGNLNIDFDQSRFSTDLNLSHAATGNVAFSAQGRIDEAGYFTSLGVDQRMAGAVTIDGREAGYFFEKQLLDGGIQGLTLWDRK